MWIPTQRDGSVDEQGAAPELGPGYTQPAPTMAVSVSAAGASRGVRRCAAVGAAAAAGDRRLMTAADRAAAVGWSNIRLGGSSVRKWEMRALRRSRAPMESKPACTE